VACAAGAVERMEAAAQLVAMDGIIRTTLPHSAFGGLEWGFEETFGIVKKQKRCCNGFEGGRGAGPLRPGSHSQPSILEQRKRKAHM